jgi:hypothetical protein
MFVDMEVDSSPKLVEKRGRSRCEQVMRSKVKRVTHDVYHLVILKYFCIVFQESLLLCCWSDIPWNGYCAFLNLHCGATYHWHGWVADVPQTFGKNNHLEFRFVLEEVVGGMDE